MRFGVVWGVNVPASQCLVFWARGLRRLGPRGSENADGVAKSANPFAMLDNFEEGWGEGEIFSMVAEPGDAVIHSSKTLHW